jgi:hypothetical protein
METLSKLARLVRRYIPSGRNFGSSIECHPTGAFLYVEAPRLFAISATPVLGER